ncbi:DMT family transporter [Poseidonibacter sp.]|uniref:DMT family transporter n=1 Tax=Poseidonibacter sp. TaxID=2321188 RepID=UPI003C70C6A6
MLLNIKQNEKLLLTIFLSLIFLALNSILCKAALVSNLIDAYSFTFFRIISAALTLILIYLYKNKKLVFNTKTNWLSSFMLFIYAICFSYSYLSIDAGFGTLLLFAIVQLVMVFASLFYKEKINIQKVIGIVLAIFGLIYLLYPTQSFEVSFYHAFLMIISGVAWAIYTIIGKKSINALANTMDNFIKATLFIVLFYFVFTIDNLHYSFNGVVLALISGSITSALGYVLWYEVLPKIQIITAGVIQLFVPILSIILSIIFLNETLTNTLLVSTVIIILGILITIFSKTK